MTSSVNSRPLSQPLSPSLLGDTSGRTNTQQAAALSYAAASAFSVSSFTPAAGASASASASASTSPADPLSSIAPGGCAPPSQQQDIVSQVMSLIMNVLQMVMGLLKGGGEDCPTPGGPASPGGDNCQCPPPSDPSCPGGPSTPGEPSPSQPGGKTWDVFFDSKEGTKTKQKSPIILDLNGNGRPDITGNNIKGDGKIDGKAVEGFDLDPSKRQWGSKSIARRPGKGAPELPPGTTMTVFDKAGNKVSERAVTGKGKKADTYGLKNGERAEFRDKDGKLVGELKKDEQKNKLMYFWDNKNQNEWTKPWGANGGDGILAWDNDGDGKITSSKELFGEWDVDGQKKFSNGYEKLAKYFDKDHNGKVEGDELNGLKIWEDRNGDGLTQKGELVELKDRGITSLNVNFDPNDMSSQFNK